MRKCEVIVERALTEGSEFHRGLKQVQSVKRLERYVPLLLPQSGKRTPDSFHKIPTIIFAKKSQKAENTIKYMQQCVMKNFIMSDELPDMIVIPDTEIIYYTTNIELSVFNKFRFENKSKSLTGDYFLYLKTGKEYTLPAFMLLLYSVIPPKPKIVDSFLLKYLKQGLSDLRDIPITAYNTKHNYISSYC